VTFVRFELSSFASQVPPAKPGELEAWSAANQAAIAAYYEQNKASFFEQGTALPLAFPQRKAAQRPHESNSVNGAHRLVKPAFFGQIAHVTRLQNGAVGAKQGPRARVGINDPQQGPQHGCFAGTIWTQNAKNATCGNFQVHTIDRTKAVELL
jgi:hypothetical protein